MSRIVPRLCVGVLVCVVAAPVLAQDGTVTKDGPGPADDVSGRITSLRGRGAKVSRAGGPGVPLKVGDALGPGDRVTTGGAVVEVTLGDPERPEAADRVALGKRTRAVLGALDDPADLSLEEGELFGVSSGELTVRAGRSLVTLHEGDVRIELSRKGALVVEVHMGFVAMVTGGGEEIGLKGGDRAKVDEGGRLGKIKRFTPKPSKWLASLRFVDPRAVLWHMGFDDLAERSELKALRGTLQGDGTIKALGNDRFSAQRVGVSNTDPDRSLFVCAAGTRVRVRYRVSAPTKVTIQSWCTKRRENFRVQFSTSRAGLWTEVEFPIERFYAANSQPGRAGCAYLRAGDAMVSCMVYAGSRGDAVILEVDELLVYNRASRH